LITLLYCRAVVRSKSIPQSITILREELKDLGLLDQSEIPDAVMLVFLQEALRRAAGREKDNRPRCWGFDREIEWIAREIVSVYRGRAEADSRIRSILEFHDLIDDESGNR
jgi:hypothetical protein